MSYLSPPPSLGKTSPFPDARLLGCFSPAPPLSLTARCELFGRSPSKLLLSLYQPGSDEFWMAWHGIVSRRGLSRRPALAGYGKWTTQPWGLPDGFVPVPTMVFPSSETAIAAFRSHPVVSEVVPMTSMMLRWVFVESQRQAALLGAEVLSPTSVLPVRSTP